MRDMYRKLLLVSFLAIAGSLSLGGCAEYLVGKHFMYKTKARILITENQNYVRNCEFIIHVKSKKWSGIALREEGLQRAISNLTHDATKAGANVLLLKDQSKSMMGASASGDAYRCAQMDLAPVAGSSDTPAEVEEPSISTKGQVESAISPSLAVEDVSERLIQLKDLRDRGILTEEEYMEKRKGLVDKL